MSNPNRIAKLGIHSEHIAAWAEQGVAKAPEMGIRIEHVDGRLDGWIPLDFPGAFATGQYNDLSRIHAGDFAALREMVGTHHLDHNGCVVRVEDVK